MYIFVPEQLLACITSNGLNMLVFDRLAIWHSSVIRPVLEYCAAVWHHRLKKYQTEAIEAIRRRAIRIVYPVTMSMPYGGVAVCGASVSLSDRCDKL